MIQAAEKKAAEGLQLERKLQTEMVMNQIPEREEPEDTARVDGKPQTAHAGHVDIAGDPIRANIQTATFAEDQDEKNYRTSPRNGQSSFIDEIKNDIAAPKIEIDDDSLSEYDDFDPVSINREILLRLIKVGVLKHARSGFDVETVEKIKASSEEKWPLSKSDSVRYMNGILFGRYLIFLKKHMKHQWNQIWSFQVKHFKEMRSGKDEQVVVENWNIINNELDVSEIESPFCIHGVSVMMSRPLSLVLFLENLDYDFRGEFGGPSAR